MAKGFSQVQDVDYSQTFAPIQSSASIKILAAVANELGLKIFRLEVAGAFVRVNLDSEIYMKLPDGCGDMSGTIVALTDNDMYVWSQTEQTAVGWTTGGELGRILFGAV